MQPHPTIPITIYALRDPDTGAPAYVGQTSRPLARRLNAHIQDRGKNCPRGRWITQLLSQGKRPVIMALELTDDEHADERERFHIVRLLTQGHKLTNTSMARVYPLGTAPTTMEFAMDDETARDNPDSPPDIAAQPEGVSVAEAAAMLGLHANTIRHRLKRGLYPCAQVLTPYGAAYMIPRAAIEAELALATKGYTNGVASNGLSPQEQVVQLPRTISLALESALAPLVEELARARAEAAAAHERAGRLQAERDAAILERNVERTRRYEREQRRAWWRLW